MDEERGEKEPSDMELRESEFDKEWLFEDKKLCEEIHFDDYWGHNWAVCVGKEDEKMLEKMHFTMRKIFGGQLEEF